MGLIHSAGGISYNGVQFNASEVTDVDIAFKYDPSGRTVEETIYTFKVDATIAEGGLGTQTATVENILAALERPGGRLVVSGKGGLNLDINGAGERDLSWGPKPTRLGFQPAPGPNMAARIKWMVEVARLGCDNAAWAGRIKSLTYTIEFARDRSGFTRLTYSGLIRIPMTRAGVNNRRIPDSADSYFDAIVPAPPKGFRREVSTARLNEAKDAVSFTFTDEELPAPLPEGVVDARGNHSQENHAPHNFARWNGSIEMEYEVAKDKPRSICWNHFLDLAEQRIRNEIALGAPNTFCAPVRLQYSEPLYQRESASYSLSYFLVAGQAQDRDKGTLYWFPTGGMWKAVPGDHTKWAASLADGAQHPRGHAKLVHLPGEAILDLCENPGEARLRNRANAVVQGRDANIRTAWEEVIRRLKVPEKPARSATWLAFEARLIVQPIDNVTAHVPLATSRLQSRYTDEGLPPASQSSTLRTYQFHRQESPPPLVQTRASPGYYLWLVGRALRIAYTIPQPRLERVGKSPAIPMNHPSAGCFWSTWEAGYSAWPIYASEFALRYFVERQKDDRSMVEVPSAAGAPGNIFGV